MQPITEMKAVTLGIGQLIMQRKSLSVPEHQRDYAWPQEEVDQFIDDISEAISSKANDYFIGLVVSVYDSEVVGNWQILDGQQRIATTTMIYSAIAQWLTANGFDAASGHARKMIGTRDSADWFDLTIKPILTLNVNNAVNFRDYVANDISEEFINKALIITPKNDSNRTLLEAVLRVRYKISEYARRFGEDINVQARALSILGNYIENSVRVVEVAVPSAADAYIIFESLNDRGLDLSVMDLIKNYMLKHVKSIEKGEFQDNWVRMNAFLRDKSGNSDDFIKTYWTSMYGRTQKGKLYSQWRLKFPSTKTIIELSRDMAVASEQYAGLEVADSDIWSGYGQLTQDYVRIISLIGGRQMHPIMLAALRQGGRFEGEGMRQLLNNLIVVLMRYQLVGRGRTGLLEIASARIASKISQVDTEDRIDSPYKVWQAFQDLVRSDDIFREDFRRFSDNKSSRLKYILGALNAVKNNGNIEGKVISLSDIGLSSDSTVEHILPQKAGSNWREVITKHREWSVYIERIGNLLLLEKHLNREAGGKSFNDKKAIYDRSSYQPAKDLSDKAEWTIEEIVKRQDEFAELAVSAWPMPKGS